MLGSLWAEVLYSIHIKPPRFFLAMTCSHDQLQVAGAPQKQEWVTPKISPMGTDETEGKTNSPNEFSEGANTFGPS